MLQEPEGSTGNSMWASSLFSSFFELELDPCPDSVADLYGTPERGVVTLEETVSASCGDWLEYEGSCYFKSSYLDVSINWEDADARWA